MPDVLYESEAIADIRRLDAAWQSPETFAFVPDKSGATGEAIARALTELPPSYRSGHYALLTSGSTGRPKVVFGSKERSEALARVLHGCQFSDPVAEAIVALPLTYCYSFVNQFLWARIHNRRLVLTKGLTRPDELRASLLAATDSMLCLVGAQVPLFIEYFRDFRFPGIVRLHFAGGRFPSERVPELRTLFPSAKIFNNYGCAEAMPRLSLRPAEAAEAANHVGWPLPGIEVDSSPEGELLFRSPYGAVAYADAAGFHGIGPAEWVATGDLGRLADDGHIDLVARSSEVFKRYGEKISIPTIMETVTPAWRGRAASYREIDSAGENGYVLVLAPHPDMRDVREVLSALRSHHPRSHWPLRLESLVDIPLLPNGKVDTQALAGQPDLQQHWRQRI